MRRLVVAVVFLAFVSGVAASGEAPQDSSAPADANSSAPRTPWGDPDLQGFWSTDDSIGVPVERPDRFGDRLFLTDEEIADRATRDEQAFERSLEEFAAPVNPDAPPNTGPPAHWGERGNRTARQTSFVVDPPDGKIPAVTPAGLARTATRDRGSFGAGPFDGPEDFTNYDRCISRSVVGSILPRPYGNGLQIVQTPGYLAIRHEMIHDTRIIPLDGSPHLGESIRQYMGDSRGRWEGDTLVVETRNLTDKTSIGFNGNGLRHSEAMHLVERFRRVNAGTIQYEVILTDPKTYAAPFSIALPLTTQPGYYVYEYACHEGNYGLPNILSGARQSNN